MALQWVYVNRRDISRGIDTFSARSAIPDGFAEDLVNFDTSASGKLEKRRGYEGYYGWVPWRVASVTHTGTSIQLTFADSTQVDFTGTTPSPLVIYGKLSAAQSGDFSTTAVAKYYSTFTVTSAAVLTVTDAGGVSASYTDTNPELTVWGLGHDGVYAAAATAGGHVTHLDSYRRAGEERLVCGLGGVLFGAYTYAEEGTDYLMPSLRARCRATVNGAQSLAPLFHPSDPGAVRTRGYVYDASVSTDNYAVVTAATYVSAGVVDYTLTWTSKTGAIADGGVLAAGYDKLTVAGLANPQHTGDWVISSVTSDAAGATVLRCANAAITSAHYDETGARGKAGVFTDAVTTTAEAVFAAGDLVQGSAAVNAVDPTVAAVNSTTLYLAGITATTAVANAEVLYVTRTSRVVPLVNGSGTATAANMVLGDMLDVLGYDRKVRVVGVRTAATASGTLSGSAGVATVTQTAHGLVAGDYVTLTGVVGVSGTYEVLSAPTADTFTVSASVYTGTVQVVGTCVTLDESLAWTDAASAYTTLQAEGRWLPLEVPTTTATLGASTRPRLSNLLDFDSQAAVSSVALNDSLYLTDGQNRACKFDGTNAYHAGLLNWPAGLFASVDTASSAAIATGATFSYTSRSTTGKYFVMDFTSLAEGDRVYDATAEEYYTVTKVVYDEATEDYHVCVRAEDDISLSAATGTLTRVAIYKYYIRFVLVDANGYQAATAAMQSEDLVVEYEAAGAIRISCVYPPQVGAGDWDRLEIEIYRTKAGGNVFYRVYRQRVVLTATSGTGEFVFIDTQSDSTLSDVDSITQALVPAPELGTGWEGPPQATRAATLAGRILLGDLTGPAKTSIVFHPLTTTQQITSANIAGDIFTFRKDSADAGTTTDSATVARFEFVNPGNTLVSFDFDPADVNIGTNEITQAAHGLATGNPVTFSSSGTLPAPLAINTTYYVYRLSSSVINIFPTFSDAMAGTNMVNITTTGAGTHTLQLTTVGTACGAVAAAGNVTYAAVNTLTAGDWVYLFHSTVGTDHDLSQSGWFRVATASAANATFTIEAPARGTAGGATSPASRFPDRFVTATVGTDIPVWVGNAGLDGNYSLRDGNPAGADLTLQLPRRLADAINSTQRKYSTTAGAAAPWMVAYAGNDYAAGQLVVRAATPLATTPEVVLPSSYAATYDLYVNNVKRTDAEQVAFESALFPSRVVRSYPNYPEIFDSPFASDATYSDSIIDVNPADGQEITGLIPFFGDSATGTGSQLSQALLVFKTNSVYLVDVETRVLQKLNTRGQGCTAPQSIAQTKDGVMFANATGVFRINRDMSCSPVSRPLKRKWADDVNRDELARAAGHHYPLEQVYKLSVPVSTDAENSEVLVYDYEREGQGQEYGAWTVYNNHPATWWCSLGDDSYFASTKGDVFKVRRRREVSDYRDDAAAISASATLRAEDFDLPGVRKAIAAVSTSIELPETDLTGLTVATAANLSADFVTAGNVTLDSSEFTFKVFDATPVQRRGTHIQVKYTHATIDEGCVLAGTQYTVAQLSGKRVTDTGDT